MSIRARALPAPASRSAGDERLVSIRRIDWRFLLPSPELGRVALLQRDAAAQREALQSEARSFVELSAEPADGPRSCFDLVVAGDAGTRTLHRALRLLRPGGWLYVEGRRGRGVSPPGALSALTRSGFQNARSHWHWPNHEAALEIVPLDAPSALTLGLRRRGASRAASVKSWLGRAAVGSGAFPRLAPAWSVMARRPAGRIRPERSAALAFLEGHRERLGLRAFALEGPLTSLLVTPRFRASSHVVHLVQDEADPEPKLVVKLPRLAGCDAFVQREAANLEALAARGVEPASVPRLVALEPYRERMLLVQTAVKGHGLERSRVRSDPERWCAAALTWLRSLSEGSEPRCLRPEDLTRLVTAPLKRLESSAEFSREELGALARTRALAERLRGVRLPAVFEHGDFCPPNVLRRPLDRLGVLDWEGAEPTGLPASDLIFFLAYVAFAREQAVSTEACVRAFRGAFLGPDAWSRPWIDRYRDAIGLPAETLAPLFVLCWARTLARLVDRILGADEGRLSDTTLGWLRANRYYALWRHALEHVGELGIPAGPGARA